MTGPPDGDELLERAWELLERAYAPYSGHRVGAALRADDGTIHAGCNVESASYGLTICAERAAVSAAVGAGRTRFRRLALVTSGSEPRPPCGACRQVLAEFEPELEVISEAGGRRRRWTLDELFPVPFTLNDENGHPA